MEQVLTDKVREVIAGELGCAVQDVELDDSLIGDLDFDSLELAQLILELEHVIGIEIPDDDLVNILTVQNIVDYAWEKLKPAQ